MIQRVSVLFSLAALVALAACGGNSPMSPSSAQGIVIRGSVTGQASTQSRSAAAAAVVVTVQEAPAITTTVGADGSFTLRGLPEGDFTLVFTRNGTVIGTLGFDGVQPNQEITIMVSVTSSSVTLLDERRNGIGHGAVEIEGRVTAVLLLDPNGDSRFLIAGYTVVARPGQTAIRKGGAAGTVADVTVGRQVHVKGAWMPSPSASQQSVLALEIKLQGGSTTPGNGGSGGGGGGGQSQCAAPGAHAEVEGLITSKGGSSITVFQQGKGDYLCQVSGGTSIHKGNTTYSFADLQPGWRVHVKGDGLGAAGGACQVQANEVMVQQK